MGGSRRRMFSFSTVNISSGHVAGGGDSGDGGEEGGDGTKGGGGDGDGGPGGGADGGSDGGGSEGGGDDGGIGGGGSVECRWDGKRHPALQLNALPLSQSVLRLRGATAAALIGLLQTPHDSRKWTRTHG